MLLNRNVVSRRLTTHELSVFQQKKKKKPPINTPILHALWHDRHLLAVNSWIGKENSNWTNQSGTERIKIVMATGASWAGRTLGRSRMCWDFTAQDRTVKFMSWVGWFAGWKILAHTGLLPVREVVPAIRGSCGLDSAGGPAWEFF